MLPRRDRCESDSRKPCGRATRLSSTRRLSAALQRWASGSPARLTIASHDSAAVAAAEGSRSDATTTSSPRARRGAVRCRPTKPEPPSNKTFTALNSPHETSGIQGAIRVEAGFERTHLLDGGRRFAPNAQIIALRVFAGDNLRARLEFVHGIVKGFDSCGQRARVAVAHAQHDVAVHHVRNRFRMQFESLGDLV